MNKKAFKLINKIQGMCMSDLGRAANMVWFSFSSHQSQCETYALHIQCSWRLRKKNRIYVACRDLYTPRTGWRGNIDCFDWDVSGKNRYDQQAAKLKEYSDAIPIIVDYIELNSTGDLRIGLSDEFVIELFPDNSTHKENWRFFCCDNDQEHVVATCLGVGLE